MLKSSLLCMALSMHPYNRNNGWVFVVKFSRSCGPERSSENDNLTEITIFEPVVVPLSIWGWFVWLRSVPRQSYPIKKICIALGIRQHNLLNFLMGLITGNVCTGYVYYKKRWGFEGGLITKAVFLLPGLMHLY